MCDMIYLSNVNNLNHMVDLISIMRPCMNDNIVELVIIKINIV